MPLPVPNESPTLADLVNDAIAVALYRLRTTQPGHVVSYDPDTNTATIQCALKEGDFDLDGSRITKTPAPISDCPVHFIGNADFWISTPMTPGTPGLIVSCSTSLDAWSGAKAGSIIDPKNDERHHISNSVFIPGIRPPRSAIGGVGGTPQDAIVINGAKILLGDSAAIFPVLTTLDGADFMIALANAIATMTGALAPFAAPLTALQTALIPLATPSVHTGSNWPVGSSTTKAK